MRSRGGVLGLEDGPVLRVRGGRRCLRRTLPPHRLHEAGTFLAQDALDAADRVALAVKQMMDAAQKIHVVGPVIAAAAAALHRPDLWKTALPESQHVLRNAKVVGDLAD